jgi:peptide/nickel transport system substrate-binding protein
MGKMEGVALRKSGALLRLISSVFVGSLVAAACAPATTTPGASASSNPTGTGIVASDKTFVFGVGQNPVGGCDGTQITVTVPVGNCPLLNQEGLVRYDEVTKSVAPSLATSWTFDGTSATFKLRQNVKFQDGTPFNADAVVFNYRRVWDTTFAANTGVKFPLVATIPIASVEKMDDATVKVNFKTARSDTMLLMTTFPAFIQSPTAVQKTTPADYAFHPVGTGPYKVTSYADASRFELQRDDTYWGTKPAAAKIVIVVKQDSAALVSDLLSGAIDASLAPSLEQIDQIKAAGMTIQASPSLVFYGANFNVTRAPFNDPKIRQAAEYAIDKESVTALSKGSAKPMYGAVVDGMREYNADVPAYKYDAKMSGTILDGLGWTLPAGGKVRMKGGQPLHIDVIQRTGYSGNTTLLTPLIVSNLQDAGFEVKTVTVEQALQYTAQGYYDINKWDLAVGGWSASIPDAGTMLGNMLTANWPTVGFNLGHYSNPQVDQKVAAAGASFDEKTHDQLLKDAQLLVRTDAPFLWIFQNQSMVAFNPAKVAAAPFRLGGQLDMLRLQLK